MNEYNSLNEVAVNGKSSEAPLYLANKLDDQSVDGNTALHLAAKANNLSLVKELMSRKVDVDAKNSENWTALHYAVYCSKNNSHLTICDVLLKHKADPNAQESNGYTPLHLLMSADAHNNNKVLALLLQYGADFCIKDKRGETPRNFALVVMSMFQTIREENAYNWRNINENEKRRVVEDTERLGKVLLRTMIGVVWWCIHVPLIVLLLLFYFYYYHIMKRTTVISESPPTHDDSMDDF